MRSSGKYNEEIINRAKALFVGGMTLETISSSSKSLLGIKVPHDTLKKWSQDYYWEKERGAAGRPLAAGNISDEVNIIREIIFRQIVAESKSGLLVTGENIEEAMVALGGIEDISVTEISPRGVDSTLVNSYMNLLTKAKVDVQSLNTSGKTPRQQVLDIAKKAKKDS